ncbi:MAG: peptidylprolyl isomerase [Planctomycetes bacterium]|nr:peptidylprolyl isomerase [Planctomycetota bacterium]
MPQAIVHTSKGDITLNLFDKTAPNTVANFIKLAKEDFYEGMKFHRVIPNFMIQGGCPNSKDGESGMPGSGGPGYMIDCEVGPENPEVHTPGTLSMAKQQAPNTGGSQFFITHTATPHLDGAHTVFGRIAEESMMDIVNAIETDDNFNIEIVD